jgi:hypothetical protein
MPVGQGAMTLPGGVVIPVVLDIKWQNDPSGAIQAEQQMLSLQQRATMLAQSVQSLGQAYMMIQFSQMRQMISADMVENANLRLESAQERYNDSLKKGGPSSREAIKAQRELEIAHNQVERATARANMLMQQQFLEIIPMGMMMVTALTGMYSALAGAKAIAGGTVGVALLAGSIAAVAGMTAMSMPKMHGGGVVEETGPVYLEKGETVNTSRGGVIPQRSSSGGGSTTINVHPPKDMDVTQLGNDLYEMWERNRRRTSPHR